MRAYLYGAVTVVALAGYGWGWYEHVRPRPCPDCAAAVRDAVDACREGYVAPVDAPSEPVAPPRPHVRVEVRVEDPPPAEPPSLPPPGDASSPSAGGGCLDGAYLTGSCDVDLVVPGGVPMARGTWSAQLRDGEGDVLISRGPEPGETVIVAQPDPLPLGAALPVPRRWSAEIRAGYGRDGWAAGASLYGRSRVGGWISAERGGGAGGVAIRLGR